jgi:hypothetical protein
MAASAIKDEGHRRAASAAPPPQKVFIMTEAASHHTFSALKVSLLAGVLAMAGCSGMMKTPTEQNIAGLSPLGHVTITEDFVAGMGGGSGTLEYQGRSYPFRFVGTVAGPGGGVEKISASGPVYKLANVSDFGGRYTQSTGKAGFSSSGSSDLWLKNSTGVVMHLQGTSTGAMLTLGKDELFIRMPQ